MNTSSQMVSNYLLTTFTEHQSRQLFQKFYNVQHATNTDTNHTSALSPTTHAYTAEALITNQPAQTLKICIVQTADNDTVQHIKTVLTTKQFFTKQDKKHTHKLQKNAPLFLHTQLNTNKEQPTSYQHHNDKSTKAKPSSHNLLYHKEHGTRTQDNKHLISDTDHLPFTETIKFITFQTFNHSTH